MSGEGMDRFLVEPVWCLRSAGGVEIASAPRVSMVIGQHLMAVKLHLPAGFVHPWHQHPEHESMGVVVAGLVHMRIGDTNVELRPGDTWHHPVGVYHSTRAVDESWVVEMHSPLRPDLVALTEKDGTA